MRSSGVLMHMSSLPSPYGIGTMGKQAKQFVDFLEKAGQTYWQMLPICPTSYGDSPYQSPSGFAGNPYFIDLDILCTKKLLKKSECRSYQWNVKDDTVDYALLYENRYDLLRKAKVRFFENVPQEYWQFCEKEADWLDDFALFMALKEAHNGAQWSEWERPLKFREAEAIAKAKDTYADEIDFWKMLQYLFFEQWCELKNYANEQGIRIIGDIPIYVAFDGADSWAHPELFQFDEECLPKAVAGCPPDAFSADGQLWGNPLFRWDVMREDGYSWWTMRLRKMSTLYDVIRIDHFRGFDSYYAIPGKDTTARNGVWRNGPGMELFRAVEEKLGKLDIIVEDLGFLTPSVLQLVADSGYPGMKVVQFAFDSRDDSDYMPHNYDKHCVVYTGTHDNDTILGWMKQAPKNSVKKAKEYLRMTKEEGYNWGMMCGAWMSSANLAVVTMQDLIGLGSSARMNIPSTLGGNWTWRALPGQINAPLANKLHHKTELYGRLRR